MDVSTLTDPSLDAFLDETRALNRDLLPRMAAVHFDLSTVEGAVRARSEAGAAFERGPATPVPATDRVIDTTHGAVPVRLILPDGDPSGVYIDIHVEADPGMPLHDAHVLSGMVKSALRAEVPETLGVLVHMEPGAAGSRAATTP